jgi:hypothetical protein
MIWKAGSVEALPLLLVFGGKVMSVDGELVVLVLGAPVKNVVPSVVSLVEKSV